MRRPSCGRYYVGSEVSDLPGGSPISTGTVVVCREGAFTRFCHSAKTFAPLSSGFFVRSQKACSEHSGSILRQCSQPLPEKSLESRTPGLCDPCDACPKRRPSDQSLRGRRKSVPTLLIDRSMALATSWRFHAAARSSSNARILVASPS